MAFNLSDNMILFTDEKLCFKSATNWISGAPNTDPDMID